jgi:hypothetical protein
MIRREYYQGPKVTDDLMDFNPSESSITIFGNSKNIDRLKDLNITNLWVIGVRDKELHKILSCVKPQFINLYQILIKDLAVLENLTCTETIVLRWNTKSESLWNIARNTKLKELVIEDFPKISSIAPISNAANLEYLILEGGMWNSLKIDTLNPISDLKKLQFLRLANMHVKEGGLKPIAELRGLKELMLSNQFDTVDYAYLAAKLPDTECDYFKPYIKYESPIGKNDTMIVGKRKPFLNSKVDKEKMEKYEKDFYAMVKQFSLE